MNDKTTSKDIAKLATDTLNNKRASIIAKKLAGSALSQASSDNQTGADLQEVASAVLKSNKYSEDTKSLAGSVLAQANKNR